MVMENEKDIFQAGDLVEITDGTHTDKLPFNRTGLILERIANGVYNIKFTNRNWIHDDHGIIFSEIR